MSDELPEGWTVRALPDVLTINPPKPRADALPASTAVSFVPMPAVDADRGVIDVRAEKPFGQVRKAYTAFADGDVLLAKITPCFENGKAAVASRLTNGVGFGSSEFFVLRTRGGVLPEYVFHYVRQQRFRDDGAERMNGAVGQARVPVGFLQSVELPIAPLAEQRRIVEKVDALLDGVKHARDRLAKVPLILKRFRQSVLAAACSGQLGGVREAEVDAPYDFLPSLPRGWQWMTAEEACERVVDCHNKTAPYTEQGVRLLRTTNIRDGKLVLDDARFVSEETYAFWSRRCPPLPGDILFTREAPMGEAAMIPDGLRACMGQRMMLLRARESVVTRDYLLLAVRAPHVRAYAEHVAVGSGVLHMRVGDVERLPIPIPPRSLQDMIVHQANAMLAAADGVAERVEAATKLSNALPQAVLSKAFSGELVPTEADLARREGRRYESANALLTRLPPATAGTPPSRTRTTTGRKAARRNA